MAQVKITDLTELAATPDGSDIIPIVDDPAGSPETKKITVDNLLSSLAQSLVGGRLTLTTATPVTTGNVTAATTLYYTPYLHDLVGLYDGSKWAAFQFTERSIAVPATTDTNYDVFLYDNAGTLTLELTAWTNDTTRATALVYQDGVYVRSGATTRRYLGSFRTTDVSGQAEDGANKRFVWNYNNRVRRYVTISDNTSHAYTTTSWRAWNNDATLRCHFLIGVSEDIVDVSGDAYQDGDGAQAGSSFDATSAANRAFISDSASQSRAAFGTLFRIASNALGYHFVQLVELGAAGADFTYIRADVVLWG